MEQKCKLTKKEVKQYCEIRKKILNRLVGLTQSFEHRDKDNLEILCNYKETLFFQNKNVGSICEPFFSVSIRDKNNKSLRFIILSEEELAE